MIILGFYITSFTFYVEQFEELANQFIPSDPTWRGWMKIALHQPLVPVLPVAKELFSKTKWIASKGRMSSKGKKGESLEDNEILVSNSPGASSLVRIQRYVDSSGQAKYF